MSDPDPQEIDLSQVRPGPIRHESLSQDLLDQIRAIFDILGPFLGQTLEQFEIGFMRDMHPESEVAIWACIATAWHNYHVKYLNSELLPEDQEKKLVGALIVISAGGTAEQTGMPPEIADRLMACYEGRESP